MCLPFMVRAIALGVSKLKLPSLKSRFAAIIALVVLVTVVLISFLSNWLINVQFEAYITEAREKDAQEIVTKLGSLYAAHEAAWDMDALHTLGMFALYDGYIIKVYDGAGQSVWDAEYHDMSLCAQVMQEISEQMREKYPRANGEFIAKNYPIIQEGQVIGAVTISYYGPYFLNESDFKFLQALNGVLLGVGCLALLLSVLIGSLMARNISRPISNAIEITKEIAAGHYHAKFEEVPNIQELAEMTAAITHLSDTLQRQERLRKQMTADISHELRTPLTTVRTHLEAMMEGVWEPTEDRLACCQEELERITKIVQELEELSIMESGAYQLQKSQVNLRELAETCSRAFESELYQKQQRLSIQGQIEDIKADADKLLQVARNLLSNAIKYTPEGGTITVCFKETATQAIMEVINDGPGIPQTELPFIFERFYRADKSRNRKLGGSGIGLAVVKAIVEAHGGSVGVFSQEQVETRFVITLPKQ